MDGQGKEKTCAKDISSSDNYETGLQGGLKMHRMKDIKKVQVSTREVK